MLMLRTRFLVTLHGIDATKTTKTTGPKMSLGVKKNGIPRNEHNHISIANYGH